MGRRTGVLVLRRRTVVSVVGKKNGVLSVGRWKGVYVESSFIYLTIQFLIFMPVDTT